MSEPKPLTAGRCCYEPLDDTGLENLRYIYQGILDMEHGRDGKENTIRVLFATIDARDALESERDAYRKEVERQGSALRAVAELVQRWRRDIDPANQVDKHEPFYDEGIEDSADELEMTLKAALAQTEPQTADEAKENTLDG